MAILKIFKPFLKLTSESKRPTDLELDEMIDKLKFYMPAVNHLISKIVWKQFIRTFKYRWRLLIGWSFMICAFATVSYFAIEKYVQPIIITHEKISKIEIYRRDMKSWQQFMNDVGMKEASGDWENRKNPTHHGMFQFSKKTLEIIGINVTLEEFLKSPELQVAAFKLYLRINAKTYRKYIYRWDGRKINNVRGTVTTSGILMSFFLLGDDAKKFYDSYGKDIPADGNGTKVNVYIEKFSGYELPSYVTDVLAE